VLDCTLFAGDRPGIVRGFARKGMIFDLEEGMSLRILGIVSVWDRGGKYQLIVKDIDLDRTVGDKPSRLRRMIEKLRREGVLQANSMLPMPAAPLKVGLITAKDSAACNDFLERLRESGYPFEVYASWAVVQGEKTSESVVKAFNRLLRVQGIDVVVLTRGGGSAVDLAWFNDEGVAHVISQVPWPVISGIGHETDTTLPDFACHTSLRTPTQCAEFLVNRVSDFLENVESLAMVLHGTVTLRIAAIRNKFSALAAMIPGNGGMALGIEKQKLSGISDTLRISAENRLRNAEILHGLLRDTLRKYLEPGRIPALRAELEMLRDKLASSALHRLAMENSRLSGLDAVVSGNDPARLYGKGWATVRNKEGKLVTGIEEISLGNTVEVRLADGAFRARTEKIDRKAEKHG